MRKFMKKITLLILLIGGVIFGGSIKDYQFISPVPGSDLNSRESTIIIREGSGINSGSLHNSIFVTGNKSGKIKGEIVLASDGKTIILNRQINLPRMK